MGRAVGTTPGRGWLQDHVPTLFLTAATTLAISMPSASTRDAPEASVVEADAVLTERGLARPGPSGSRAGAARLSRSGGSAADVSSAPPVPRGSAPASTRLTGKGLRRTGALRSMGMLWASHTPCTGARGRDRQKTACGTFSGRAACGEPAPDFLALRPGAEAVIVPRFPRLPQDKARTRPDPSSA